MGSKKCGEKKSDEDKPKKYQCKKCGASSNKEKKLCKPKKQ